MTMQCTKVRNAIDESDRPDLLPREVTAHTRACPQCLQFAEERARLKELVTSVGRVSAPANFDAVLRARLADRRAKRRLSWLSQAAALRLGAATAVLLAAVVVVQYMVTRKPTQTVLSTDPVAAAPQPRPSPTEAKVEAPVTQPPDTLVSAAAGVRASSKRPKQLRTTPESEAPIIWLRSADTEIGVPIISVGAQPLYYVPGGQTGVRTVRTSF